MMFLADALASLPAAEPPPAINDKEVRVRPIPKEFQEEGHHFDAYMALKTDVTSKMLEKCRDKLVTLNETSAETKLV